MTYKRRSTGKADPAPYLLCAARVGDARFGRRCRAGATALRDGYAMCASHAAGQRPRPHFTAVPYTVLAPMLGDQFSRTLTPPAEGPTEPAADRPAARKPRRRS